MGNASSDFEDMMLATLYDSIYPVAWHICCFIFTFRSKLKFVLTQHEALLVVGYRMSYFLYDRVNNKTEKLKLVDNMISYSIQE